MTLDVIGLSFGRTATNSMKMALEELGLGPCHHMYEVVDNVDTQAPLWHAALDGTPDWAAIYDGYRSALDWPTAGFAEELYAAYPDAKYLLNTRSAESWYDSMEKTILEVTRGDNMSNPAGQVTAGAAPRAVKNSLGDDAGWTREGLIEIFNNHEAKVKALIPSDQLLVFSPLEGWEPLCAFLDVPVPEGPFPRSNDEAEFFERLE